MDDYQIKRCPHCGGVSYVHSNYSAKHRAYFTFVKCDICGSQGKTCRGHDAVEKAVSAWNMRFKEEGESNG